MVLVLNLFLDFPDESKTPSLPDLINYKKSWCRIFDFSKFIKSVILFVRYRMSEAVIVIRVNIYVMKF